MKNGLIEIMNGIYSVNPKAVFDGDIILAVHPFYNLYAGKKEDIRYSEQFISFLKRLDQPLITLESESKLEETISHYQDFTSYPNLFFIKTRDGDTQPTEMNYEKLIYYIDHLRKDKPIVLIGGYYDPNDRLNPGCLDVIKSKLSSIPHSVHKSLTF